MNILFVNYGDFTTNSLNHIAGFAGALSAQGHSCAVAVNGRKDTVSVLPALHFLPVTFEEVLARPRFFPDGRGADLIHAWTPREGVRKFVLALQQVAPARLLVHLEDNEEFLLEAFSGRPFAQLREQPEQEFPFPMVDGLSHPARYRHLLRLADAITVIADTLGSFAPPDTPVHLLEPGVDEMFYQSPADAAEFRAKSALRPGEKAIVFTGSISFANAGEIRELYQAVKLLNDGGTPTRLIRTGFTLPEFERSLDFSFQSFVTDLGFVEKSRLPALVAIADVLVQPGHPGAFNDFRLPSKVPEFLAAGKPVVLPASNIGRRLADGREALLLKTGSPEEIAAACRRIFQDPVLAGELGRNGRTFARANFDLAANSARLGQFYGRVLSQPVNPVWTSLFSGSTGLSLVAEATRRRLAASTPPTAAMVEEAAASLADLARAARQAETDLREEKIHTTNLRRHATALEKEREMLAQQFHERDLLTRELQQRELKIRQMQASFSWRSTAWLRTLRRWFIDPRTAPSSRPDSPAPGRPTSASGFHHGIDAPRHWLAASRPVVIRGWVFATGPEAVRSVRARIGARVYEGEYAIARPDLSAQFGDSPAILHSGFRINAQFKEGDPSIELEAEDSKGSWRSFFSKLLSSDSHSIERSPYTRWVLAHDTLTTARMEAIQREISRLPRQPLISVLMPVYNPPEAWLRKAIESVRAQLYPHWELCVADDASTHPHVRKILEEAAREDPRIKVCFRSENGHISAASNSALALATGEFTALLDHDDELRPHALFFFAQAILNQPNAEIIYSDEDKIDETGFRFDPHFKPDWNPDLFTSQNYFSHLTAYRTQTLREVGGFRTGVEGSQDWDVGLRISERCRADQIIHLPHILYHWRAIEGSTAMHSGEKDYTTLAAHRVLEEHFSRLGEKPVLRLIRGGHWHVRHARPEPPPSVTLIIPTRNMRALLSTCVESILAKTTYPHFEILVADNDSDDPELKAFYDRMRRTGKFEVLPCPGLFNFSLINNRAVAQARGEIVGLLNNDLEAIHPEWLDEMVAQASRPQIGAVGAKLLYPDLRIQHAGIITGLGGVAGHAFKGFLRHEPGTPQHRPHVVQNVSAVTAACLVIRKSVYLEAGGLDESLAVAFNDVDFCLKVEALGYRNLYTPFAELIHHESASRGQEDTPEKVRRFQREIELMKERWGNRLLCDPAYNPNLSLDSEDFAFAYPPRSWPS